MILFESWKGFIKEIDDGWFSVEFLAFEMLMLLVFSPIALIIDLVISPFELCYLIVKWRRNKCIKKCGKN